MNVLPGVYAHGSKVHSVFCLEDEGLGADLHDRRSLHGRGDGEQSELRRSRRRPVSSGVSM